VAMVENAFICRDNPKPQSRALSLQQSNNSMHNLIKEY